MALLNATSFAGFLLLLYLSSFVLLAILRIATGISIQRIGYFSLRHISYTPREGLRVDIRGLGLAIHRPTLIQPTWISLRLTELCVTVDPPALNLSADRKAAAKSDRQGEKDATTGGARRPPHHSPRSQLWKKLTDVKEKLKRVHRKIKWIRMIDINAVNTSLEVVGVGSLSVGAFTVAVHTRRKLLDRGRLFRHKKDALGSQRPAEWIFTVRSVLLSVKDREPVEMLDGLSINVHGLLYKEKEGLRDTSIAVKVGRLHVPVDDLLQFQSATQAFRPRAKGTSLRRTVSTKEENEITFDDVVEELDRPGSREAAIVQTVAESKEFFSSVLRGVQEVQLGVSFIRISKELDTLRGAGQPLTMNVVTHEIGIDLHRLDQSAPTHRMYFSRHDVAHQALLAMVSISVTLDQDENESGKIMYIPMATTTIKTTLPSKTMSLTQDRDAAERNSNILFANLVVTSPSVDLTPQHLIQLLSLTKKTTKAATSAPRNNHRLISRLLPRASIKMSVQEPVVRFVLPVSDPKYKDPDDYDMIISAISSMSLDVESSYSTSGELLYSLASNFRLVNHKLYYQSTSGTRHSLVTTDTLELKASVSASTEVLVVVNGVLRSFSVLMVREEVSKGVYNIVRHFKHTLQPDKLTEPEKPSTPAFLRKLPAWLLELHLEGTNCSFEAAGVDVNISPQTRGLALELESWTTDYVSQRHEMPRRPVSRRKKSLSVHLDEPPASVTHLSPPSSPIRRPGADSTDHRRLTLHLKGVQGFIIESLEEWEAKPFMSMPRAEIAFSTNKDIQGPIFHVNSAIRSFYLDFSLYRLYSIGVAVSMLSDAFLGPPVNKQSLAGSSDMGHTPAVAPKSVARPTSSRELVAVDLKVAYVQVKAQMPADPSLMLQLYDVSTGRHRWSTPFVRFGLARLNAESQHMKTFWTRLLTISAVRIDLRKSKRKHQDTLVEEQSIEVMTDFIRLGVPHGLMMYKVFDNIINTAKASAQLAYRFKTRTNTYILQKVPQKPKHVPRVSVRSKAILFELEDDPFEWKLGNIYHTGRREQTQRLAREEAFKLKVKKLAEERMPRGTSRRRPASGQPPSTRGISPMARRRSHSADSDSSARERRPRSRHRNRGGHSKLRYDRDGICALSGDSKIEEEDAWQRLQEHNARSWKKRIDAINFAQNTTMKNIRRMFMSADEPPRDADCHETVLGVAQRPGLFTIIITDLHLVIDKPSFPLSQLPDFLHDIGKGMPRDMEYDLLIPLSIALDMGEARFMLRDYPLSLLHIPAIRPGQPTRLPSWSLRTDFVIAEEFRGPQSHRHIKVEIVPKGQQNQNGEEIPGFSVDVIRTVSPVKTFSKPVIDINTSHPTSISWGTSYQPVIQDMMMIIEGFTKPEIDPSDRVGFWDKIRLSFHSRPVINWKGDGDVHLRLKGSRDPYVVTGYGAGFVMCWRYNVRWAIHEGDEPKKFMTVQSGEYVLAVPDYSRQARNQVEDKGQHDEDSITTASSLRNSTVFKKVILKVSGNVQWTAGLVFEQDTVDGGRSSDFEPHYNVILKNPKYMEEEDFHDYDAFRGFRSHHVHLSVSIAAPFDKYWSSCKPVSSESSYNSLHLSPRFFSHFFNWWSLFSGIMSLPVRQGPLWRGPEKTSKKFGRHLATIKYGILLSPLYIAHIYKHKDAEDYVEDVVSATGLKLRIDNFVFDVHQRREYFDTLSKSKSEQARTSAMKINAAEVDFVNADLRAVAASIVGTNADELRRATDEVLASSYQEYVGEVDMSRFTIPDHDFSWIDMDDFVELDWVLPADANPETKILPLSFTPRFTYFRQTDHGDGIHGDASRTSPFGKEDTHYCAMSNQSDPRNVQTELIKARLENIEEQLSSHGRLMGESELKVVREGDHDETLKEAHDSLMAQRRELEDKKGFLSNGLRRLAQRMSPEETSPQGPDDTRHPSTTPSTAPGTQSDQNHDPSNGNSNIDMDGLISASHDEFATDFNNRFIIHNAQVKWNNSLRNIILRYSHQVSQRRGFVYYMSRRAVKFIIDIVEEQNKKKLNPKKKDDPIVEPSPFAIPSATSEKDEQTIIEDIIDSLLTDGKKFVDAEEETSEKNKAADRDDSEDGSEEGIAEDFLPMNAYHVRLIAPQVQFQSEKNVKSVVLLTAKGMQLKVVSIMDKARLNDDVSGMVQRRFALDMDGVQVFVTSHKILGKYLHLYSGNRYGNAPGASWPPWVSMEAMFDFHLDPFGFQRVIQRTSASLRYEKYNPLRLKYNEEVARHKSGSKKSAAPSESRIDHLWVDFPRLRASCDSSQYYTMYIIVLDLLMYSEPLEKTRNERLEKILLATDFSDLRGAPEMAERLQDRIRQLEEIKNHFQINAKLLDKRGWRDRIDLEKDLANCEDELFFIMKAINTSQQRSEERKSSQSSGFLRWYLSASEFVWHLMRSKDEPLLEFQLGNAAYERIDNSDGSNHNAVEIEHIRGWNLLSNAIYPEIIGPFHDPTQKEPLSDHGRKMLRVDWHMLEAIAGIPVLEEFQVTMFPLKVQLERDLSKKLFEYIFPGIESNEFDDNGFSPLQIKNMKPLENDQDSEGEEARNNLLPQTPAAEPTEEQLRSSLPGAIGRRLQPTYNLRHHDSRNSDGPADAKHKHRTLLLSEHRGSRQPNQHLTLKDQTSSSSAQRRPSSASLTSMQKPRHESTTNLLVVKEGDKTPRGSILDYRSGSKTRDSSTKDSDTKSNKAKKQSDDLSQMIARASNYMTIAHIQLNSFVVCLSYKGKSERNIEDLRDFVFRLPTLEYRNKTWSNLDLALRLKKDVIRALISHTGALIGNKFSHSRPSKKQQDKLREIAAGSVIIPNSDTLINTPSVSSGTNSVYSLPTNGDDVSPRVSFQSDPHTGLERKDGLGPSPLLKAGTWSSLNASQPSFTSSLRPPQANGNGNGVHYTRPTSSVSAPRPSTRDGGIDPLGPISPPRPPTAHSALLPGRSLLKETLGRHFSGDTVKAAKVRFSGNGNKDGADEDKDDERDKDKDRDRDARTESVTGANDSEGESPRRVSVAMLKKKVLGKLNGD